MASADVSPDAGTASASDVGDQICMLKLCKSRTKTSFTRMRHQLLELCDDAEVCLRSELRSRQRSLADVMDEAMDVMLKLADIYRDNKMFSDLDKIQVDIDNVESEFSDVMKISEQCLNAVKETVSKDYDSHSAAGSPGPSSRPPVGVEMSNLRPTAVDFESKLPYVAASTPVLGPSSTSSGKVQHDLWRQLKRVSIPVFSGDKRKYEGWKASFTACIDNAPMSAEYKLLQLRQYLSGNALQAIENLGHSAASYEAAKDRLDRKFGGIRRHIAVQMEEVDSFKQIRPGYAKDVEKFADLVDVVVINLKESNRADELGYGAFYFKLLKKLPECMIRDYQRWLFENRRREEVDSLKDWLNQESEFLMIASETVQGLSNATVSHTRRSSAQSFHGRRSENSGPLLCSCCDDRHGVWKCDVFKQLQVPDRWQLAKDKKLCFRCLGVFHNGSACKRSQVCGIDGCSKLHHRLLHADSSRQSTVNPASTVRSEEPAQVRLEDAAVSRSVTMVSRDRCDSVVALRTVPVILKHGKKQLMVNALLDDGSTATYVNSDVVAELGVSGESQQVSVSVLNGQLSTIHTQYVELQMSSVDGRVNRKIGAFTTEKVTGNMMAVDWKGYRKNWSHLSGIEFPKMSHNRKVDMLIGLDYADLHTARREVCGRPGEPIARLTPLGWTCVGNTVPGNAAVRTNFVRTYFVPQIDETLRRFWEVESCRSTDEFSLSPDDRVVIDRTASTIKYSESQNRYEVEIPWKQNPCELPDDFEMAFRRLQGTEKRLAKDSQIASSYCENLDQYVKKGYINKVECDNSCEGKWYLPHFPVVRPDRSTTKTRIVFDASAAHKGISLNDAIFQGPKLQRDLADVLLRFRKNPVAVVCDISEMYLQVEIAAKDRRFFRFLWRNLEIDRPPDIYEFSRVVFGVNCSPFLAQFVAQNHAKRLSGEFPAAAETVLKSTYMDDSMDSVMTDDDGVSLYEQLTALWKLAGMHTRKWLSNSEIVLSRIPCEDQATEIELDGSHLYGAKTLGVLWLAKEDVFIFRFKPPDTHFIYTKRAVLKKVASLFDPLGFLAPYIVRAKILLQKIWASGADWDEPLNADLQSEACQWFSELTDCEQIRVPRCLRHRDCSELTSTELHVFSDASADAYGAVIYARCTYDSETVSCNLICAKTKVAPLESVSIPRLELMAAVLALNLATSVAPVLGITLSDVTFWSDSMNVLCWIRNRSRVYKPFVANRVGQIQTQTNPDQWRYVPTKVNPADVASRGLSVTNLACHPLWWSGPEFLMMSPSSWPAHPIRSSEEAASEVKKSVQGATTLFISSCATAKIVKLIDECRYSNWTRLVRVYSWMLRFVDNCRCVKDSRTSGELNADELKDTEIIILKACQQEAFSDEYKALVQKKALSSSSKLLALNPCLDDDGLIRSNSRLVNSDELSFNSRYPVILPRKHGITQLIVKREHDEGAHVSGTNRILSELSKKYWIISAREAIRECERSCMMCRRQKAKAATQLMAPLPSVRVRSPESLRAFVHTSVDYAGPFLTIQGRGRCRAKRYLCLFTCMSVRAVHLEMAYSLDTDSFLNAFYRFASRRGYPETMTSDNGRNFIGANRELQELVAKLDQRKITKSSVSHGIKWNFNPPTGSHFGGVFEIMIKAAKRSVHGILGNADVTDEELMTAFVSAEALINSRPLTYQSASPSDITPLTPSHFLHGQLGGRAAPVSAEGDRHPRNRWRRIQELTRHFWHRWLTEWLPGLATRTKWTTPSRNFAVGDVVLVLNSDTPRGSWPLGRIVTVHPGRDGRVRVVEVRIGGTSFIRPVASLCSLEY